MTLDVVDVLVYKFVSAAYI